ncbi:MAG TPA: alpha-amylase family glycosyl hydrolase, partial [Vicinamibacterales bacterium]|nr:alpha-amylase family glycosyl hydrolase [Vicinamibacterales bacterium]
MDNIAQILQAPAPQTIGDARANFPQRDARHPSPPDWRDEVLYFLLPDRFSDGQEHTRAPLDRAQVRAHRTAYAHANGLATWRWDLWRASGEGRFQGGTLAGITSKLPYLANLGVTTLWIAPVFRQRVEGNDFHGYGVQDFLDVDSRFGNRGDLVDLVGAAHARGMRVVLDIIFNHSGSNWLYDVAEAGDAFRPRYITGQYRSLFPKNGFGTVITNPQQPLGRDDYVWPQDLQFIENYTRAGTGSLGAGDIRDPNAEHKRTDFEVLRDLATNRADTLARLIFVYQYWIALTDCDGLRIDTLKHVGAEEGRNFCGAVKEFAESIGKANLLLLGEVAGGNDAQEFHLTIFARNLDAALDIGEMRLAITGAGQGLQNPADFFAGFSFWDERMGSHRDWGSRHVSVLDDHDHVFGRKVRFSADAPVAHQVTVPTALQLCGLGIPCLYYGTEQALPSGPEASERVWLGTVDDNGREVPAFGRIDVLLREAMFGPEHPRASGFAGTQGARDPALPGFGAFGTAGVHVFDESHPAFVRLKALIATRQSLRPLRRGRQYRRATSIGDNDYRFHGAGELLAWSRILNDVEVLIAVNTHGAAGRGSRIELDPRLRPAGSTVRVVCDTSRIGHPGADARGGGRLLPVQDMGEGGRVFVDVGVLPPA